jgi:hypothetical protein
MARITEKYTMGWYGGCECEDIKVSELSSTETFGRISFISTDAEGTSYYTKRNSSSFGKLICGEFYIVLNETQPYVELDIPDFHILSLNGKTLSECCDNVIVYGIDIDNLEVDNTTETNNVTLDVTLENVTRWSWSLNGSPEVEVPTGLRAIFSAEEGQHTLTVFAIDDNGNRVDEKTTFFNVKLPEKTPTPIPEGGCCDAFTYVHTKSTASDEPGFDPDDMQTGKEYGYVELQRAMGPFASLKPDLNIATLCHDGATTPGLMSPMDIQSVQDFTDDGFFNQSDFTFKHGEIAFGRQFYGKIRVTLNNGDCYEGCVCPENSEVNLVSSDESPECSCGG